MWSAEFFFSGKQARTFHAVTICMKCKSLFSGKNMKNVSKCCQLKFLFSMHSNKCKEPAWFGSYWLSLSRLRWSRIIAYLEMKIWSLFKHENLTTGNKILWKRGEIAPKEQFLLFSTIFSIYLYLQESNYILICEMWLFNLFFLISANLICQGMDISKYFRESLGLQDNDSQLPMYLQFICFYYCRGFADL